MPFDEIRYCYFPFADEEMQPRETKCYVEGHTSWSVAEFKPRQADPGVCGHNQDAMLSSFQDPGSGRAPGDGRGSPQAPYIWRRKRDDEPAPNQ